MKIAVVDIETTGFLPKGLILEVGIAELDLETGNTIPIYDKLVKESGFCEDHKDSWIFKNSDLKFEDIMQADPLDAAAIQGILNSYQATAFNKRFDFEFFRSRGLKINELDCPMLLSVNVCRLPGKYRAYKWPTVEEAWKHFFPNEPYSEKHRGVDDALHEAKIVYELYKMGVFKVPQNTPTPAITSNQETETMNCKSCGKEIIWLSTKDTANHPFNKRKTLVAVLGSDNKTHVVMGHVSHFASCPNAAEHSRK